MPSPANPSEDANRTSPHTPEQSSHLKSEQTTDPKLPPDTVDHVEQNGNAQATGEYQGQHTASYVPPHDPTKTIDYVPSRDTQIARKIPGYEIQSKIGEGGMGVVYKARDLKLNRIVAIKMIRSAADAGEAALHRFQKEAEAVAKLQHPNIVQIFGIGETEGCPYFALEFVPGTNLADRVGKTPQEPKFAAIMVESLARAMYVAHEAKIIHRDLKPGNVLLTQDNVPKIADFGLAKELESDNGQTNTGAIMGTPSYMSPEQASGDENIGPATDIYALGAILYDLLTGRPPFAGTTKWNTLEMVRKMEPIPPGSLTSKVPQDLDTICLKCLQKEPSKRYANALELAEDIRRFLDGRPILARPVSNLEKAWRWAKRNPVVASLSSTFLVTVIGFSIVSWILKTQADDNATLANANFLKAQAAEREESKQKEIALQNFLKAQAAEQEQAKQKLIAQKNAAEASESLSQSVGIIRKLITDFQDALKSNPAGRQLLQRLTESAMNEIMNLKKRSLESTIISRTEAGTLTRLGDIFLDQNRSKDADELYQKAQDIIAKLRTNEPNDPVHVRNSAAILNKRADASIRIGDIKLAHKRYSESLILRQDWAKMPSNQIPGQPADAAAEAVAQSHMLLARTATQLGQPVEAMNHWISGVTAYKALPPDRFKSAFIQREFSTHEAEMAFTEFKLGRTDAARSQLMKVSQTRLTLLKADPKLLNRLAAAYSLRDLGNFAIISGGNPMDAWTAYQRALPVYGEVLKLDPQSFAGRREVALTHFKLGITAERLNSLSALSGTASTLGLARHHFQESLRIRESLAKDAQLDTMTSSDLALSLAQAGRVVEAEKIVDTFLKQSPTDPWVRWICANSLAMARGNPTDVSRCHEKAIGLLEAMITDGWKDFVAIRTEPTLDSLRNYPRFAKLTGGAEAGK